MPVFNVDFLADNLAKVAKSGASTPPAWDGGKATALCVLPNGANVGKILMGKGLFLNCDLKELGINKPIPNVFERSTIEKAKEKFNREWGIVEDKGAFLDPVTKSVIDPERAVFRMRQDKVAEMNGYGRGQLADAIINDLITTAALTSYDNIISARAGGKAEDIVIGKQTLTTTASDWYDLGRQAGTPGAMTYNSTTAPTQTATSRATTGAWSTALTNPTGGDKKYLLTLGWTAAVLLNMGILVDVHVQGGSFRLTVTTAETVASPVTIVREYFPLAGKLGAGCFIVFVTTTGASATATNLTVTYVDQDNNAAQTYVITNPATATIASQLWPDSSSHTGASPFQALAAGDFGVRSMSQAQSSVALAAGVLAGLLVTPLIWIPGVVANAYVERDSTVQIDGITELVTASGVIGCLNMLIQASTTSTGQVSSFMRSVAG